MKRRLITDAELIDLIGSSASAYRWEHQSFYDEPGEAEMIAEWDAGGPGHPPADHPWHDHLADMATRGGHGLIRVRVQDTPITHYQAWLAHLAATWSIPAGEHIRVMTRARANRIGPLLSASNHDWWLLDGHRIVIMTIDAATGVRTSTELREGGFYAARARAMWDLAVRNSTPVTGAVLTTT